MTNTDSPSIWISLQRNAVFIVYVLLIAVPLVQIILRPFRFSLIGIDTYLVHTVLMVGFLGAIGTGHEGRHLAIGSSEMLSSKVKKHSEVISGMMAITLLTCLTVSAITLIIIAFGGGQSIGVIPAAVLVAVIPLAYLSLCIQYISRLPRKKFLLGTIAIVIGLWFSANSVVNLLFILLNDPPLFLDSLSLAHTAFFTIFRAPFIVLIIAAAFFGLPLFLVLGGIAVVLFASQGVDLSIVPLEGYNMLTNQSLPAIPLFTLAGYILSESKASDRLVRVFRNLLGWMPGGLVITAVVASAFFTAFTGASGVTILALGGLLYPILRKEGHLSERYSVGLLTSSSNIGLLFPPSLAIILYGTIAQVNIFHVFLGGIIPGTMILVAFGICGAVVSLLSRKRKKVTYTFNLKETILSLRDAVFELLMPVVVIVALFSGIATLTETAAIAAFYAFIVAFVIKRDIKLRDFPSVVRKCVTIIGGVLIILTAARALSYVIIDAQIPAILSEWVSNNISSRFVFLIILNIVLLITGCFMDIFSAILIVAPLVIPLGDIFGIHPIHLGIIFLANMGVGFITPPVGIDLFLASYRFGKPLTKVYRYVVPFFFLELIMVLIITYIPAVSTFLLRFAEGGGGY